MANSYLAWARPRFARLQDGYLNGTYTRADLANLRNSFKKPCGSDPKASKWSLNGMDYRGYAKPTRMEQASWYAFGLYAYHPNRAVKPRLQPWGGSQRPSSVWPAFFSGLIA